MPENKNLYISSKVIGRIKDAENGIMGRKKEGNKMAWAFAKE